MDQRQRDIDEHRFYPDMDKCWRNYLKKIDEEGPINICDWLMRGFENENEPKEEVAAG